MSNRCALCGTDIGDDKTTKYRGREFCYTCYEKVRFRTRGLIVLGILLIVSGVVFYLSYSATFGKAPWDLTSYWQSFKNDDLPIIRGLLRSGGLVNLVRAIGPLIGYLAMPLVLIILSLLPLMGILLVCLGIRNIRKS